MGGKTRTDYAASLGLNQFRPHFELFPLLQSHMALNQLVVQFLHSFSGKYAINLSQHIPAFASCILRLQAHTIGNTHTCTKNHINNTISPIHYIFIGTLHIYMYIHIIFIEDAQYNHHFLWDIVSPNGSLSAARLAHLEAALGDQAENGWPSGVGEVFWICWKNWKHVRGVIYPLVMADIAIENGHL